MTDDRPAATNALAGESAWRHAYGPRWPWLFALYLSLAVICGYVSWSRIVIDDAGNVYTNQTSVDVLVSTTSDTPVGLAAWPHMRSRMLLPYLIVGAQKYLRIPHRVTHDGTRLLFIFLAAILFHWHLRRWFNLTEALTGTVLMLSTMTITFNSWFPVATDMPELVGMIVCVAALVRGRWILMLASLAVYTLNRETSVLLVFPALFLLYEGRRSVPKALAVAAAIVLTWGVMYLVARRVAGVEGFFLLPELGGAQGQGVLGELAGFSGTVWPRQMASLMGLIRNPHPYNVNWSFLLVLNVFWFLPWLGWRFVPSDARRLYFGGLVASVTVFFLAGVLNEAGRYLIPMYPIIYPAGLSALFQVVTPSDSA